MNWGRYLKKKASKYGAKRTLCSENHPHPSGLEASVCELLILRQRAKEIRNLKWQHTVHLGSGIKWKVDWSFERAPDWHPMLAEAKGVEGRDYRMKLKMYQNGGGTCPIEIWKGSAARPRIVEVVVPKAASDICPACGACK